MSKKIAVGMTLAVGAAGATMAQTASGPDLSSIVPAAAIDIVSAGIVSTDVVKIVPNVMRRAVNGSVGFSRWSVVV